MISKSILWIINEFQSRYTKIWADIESTLRTTSPLKKTLALFFSFNRGRKSTRPLVCPMNNSWCQSNKRVLTETYEIFQFLSRYYSLDSIFGEKKTIYSSEESSSSKRAGAFSNPFVMVYLPCLGFSVINITAPHPLFEKSFEKSPRPSYESWLLHRVQYKYQGYLPEQYQVTATPVSSHELQSCRRRRPGHWLEITMLRYLVPRLPQVNIN